MPVGTCGFPVSRKRYYERFQVVEVQKTFYSPISEELAERWRKEAPEDFVFTLKAPQVITHPPSSPTYRRFRGEIGDFGFFKLNMDTMSHWEKFVKVARILNARFIVFQSPPSFHEGEENVRNMVEFFSNVERVAQYGWEPRGKWREETIKRVCEELDLIHVVDPFKSTKIHGDFSYYRLHGKGGYGYRFTEEDLKWLAQMVEPEDYVMFNNTNMWEDANKFMEILRASRTGSSPGPQRL